MEKKSSHEDFWFGITLEEWMIPEVWAAEGKTGVPAPVQEQIEMVANCQEQVLIPEIWAAEGKTGVSAPVQEQIEMVANCKEQVLIHMSWLPAPYLNILK